MVRTFANENRIQVRVERLFTSKPVECFSKGDEGMPDRWQQIFANNGEHIIE